PVRHAHIGGDADLLNAAAFAGILRRERPDAALLSWFKKSFWAGWAARRAGVPRVVERWGMSDGLPDRWKYRYAFRRYIDALIVNSADIRRRWLASAPWFPTDEVHVVLNGVRPPAARRGVLRAELGLEADTPMVAGAGRLERRKGFDVLVTAFARVSLADAHLVVAGDGPEEAALRRQAAALGVGERVHWLGFREDLGAVLVDCDVFALSSRKEGMANVMLEAMAADRLVVAADISGVGEALGRRDGRPAAGWIVPREDAEAMGAALDVALRAAAEDGLEARARREETRHRAQNWFSTDRMLAETERVLRGGPGGSGGAHDA
ncbi:MAG TPA: glycosyltransferase, partial [Longimicrobiales bacterium]|nr:glycosyltransferase [Longimicrobiales bacterium]